MITNVETITLPEIAKLFAVPFNSLRKVNRVLPGFPRPINPVAGGVVHVYNLQAVSDWADGKDVKRVVRVTRRRLDKGFITPGGMPEQSNQQHTFNARAVLFLSGRYLKKIEKDWVTVSILPSIQQARLDFKKLAARTARSKTTRIRLVPDWTLDQNITGRGAR